MWPIRPCPSTSNHTRTAPARACAAGWPSRRRHRHRRLERRLRRGCCPPRRSSCGCRASSRCAVAQLVPSTMVAMPDPATAGACRSEAPRLRSSRGRLFCCFMNLAPRSPHVCARCLPMQARHGSSRPLLLELLLSLIFADGARAEPQRETAMSVAGRARLDRPAARVLPSRSKAAGGGSCYSPSASSRCAPRCSRPSSTPPPHTAASTSTRATRSANAAISGTLNLTTTSSSLTATCACSSTAAARASTARRSARAPTSG